MSNEQLVMSNYDNTGGGCPQMTIKTNGRMA